MSALHIDLESRSAVDLRKTGLYVYAEDETTDIWCACYAVDNGEVKTWVPGEPCPPEIIEHVKAGSEFWSHNAAFERIMWQKILTPKYGWPLPKLSQWNCTLARAYAMALPGSLDSASAALGIAEAKDPVGYRTMLRMAKPRRYDENNQPVWWDDSVRISELITYCIQDVVVERELHARLMELRPLEREVWMLDQIINDRGICVDRALCEAARPIIEDTLKKLNSEIKIVSKGLVPSCEAVAKIVEFCQRRGVDTETITREDVTDLLAQKDLPEDVRRVLEIRAEAGKAAVKKINALLLGCSADGRARGLLAYHGAATGRWSARRFQPQNLKRPKDKAQDDLIPLVMTGSAKTVEMLGGPPLEVVGDIIRGMLVAAPGSSFYAADFSNIEGRALAWLAGETWKVNAFIAFDLGKGHDLYKLAYGRAFGIAPEKVSSDQRQIGKVMELACLGRDTRVLTSNGVKRIVDVTSNDRLWDGVEWICHKGLVSKGVRPVVSVGGTELTPDHLVLTGKTWTQAHQLVSNVSLLHLALATSLESLQSPAINTKLLAAAPTSSLSVPAVLNRIVSRFTIFAGALQRGVINARNSNPTIGAKISSVTPTLFQMPRIVAGYSVAFLRVSRDALLPGRVNITPTMAGAASAFSLNGNPEPKVVADSLPTSSRLTGGSSLLWNWTGSILTAIMNREISGSSLKKRISPHGGQFNSFKDESTNSKPVFDIAHAGPRNRFTIITSLGPLIVHNCGFGGGVGAFQTMASAYGVEVSDARADELKNAWREAHPSVRQFWYDVEDAAKGAVNQPGRTVGCGRLAFKAAGSFLFMRLPSGRMLTYPYPKLREATTPWGTKKMSLTYKTVINPSNTRRIIKDPGNSSNWARISTYGGSLVENAVQATARDVMAEAMLRVEAAGYPVVLTVHDEIVSEAVDRDVDEFQTLVETTPLWGRGFPITAKAWTGPRYKKD